MVNSREFLRYYCSLIRKWKENENVPMPGWVGIGFAAVGLCLCLWMVWIAMKAGIVVSSEDAEVDLDAGEESVLQ